MREKNLELQQQHTELEQSQAVASELQDTVSSIFDDDLFEDHDQEAPMELSGGEQSREQAGEHAEEEHAEEHEGEQDQEQMSQDLFVDN